MGVDNFGFDEGVSKIGAAKNIGDVLYPEVIPVEADGTATGAAAKLGSLTETAPASDTASSGLNGRLQRIAQRLTTLIGSTIAVSGTFWQATQPVSMADGSAVTLGAKADAKSTATDTTAITIMSVLKQISASVQAAAASLAGTLTVGTHGVTIADGALTTLGSKADAKNSASDTTSITIMSVLKQISFSIQAAAASLAGTLTVASHAVTNAGTFAVQAASAGDVASGSSDSGNPVKIGFVGKSSEPTAVTTGQRVNGYADLVGKQIVLPYANPENFVNGTTAAITDTTSTSTIAAQGAGIRTYITSIIVTNSHATVGTFVKILDGASIIWEGYCAAAGGGFTISFPVPLRGTANTAVNTQCVTTGANVIASIAGYKGA